MTHLQQLEFEMLKEVLRICRLLDIRYYLICGSALGAVKYNGFIPWDDDIDVGMMRKDYDRFLKEAPDLLPGHLFLQNNSSDPAYPMIFSKLRDSRTTFIENSIRTLNINHGVYIDIFPLDLYPTGKAEQRMFEIKKWIYTHLLATVYDTKRSLPGEVIRRFNRLIGVHRRIPSIVKRYESLLSRYQDTDSSIVCNHGNWQGKLEYAPLEQYGSGSKAFFEGLEVTVPEKYDAYLTRKYGDWRSDPPEEEKFGHHLSRLVDLEHPYTDYIEVISDRNIRLRSAENQQSI